MKETKHLICVLWAPDAVVTYRSEVFEVFRTNVCRPGIPSGLLPLWPYFLIYRVYYSSYSTLSNDCS